LFNIITFLITLGAAAAGIIVLYQIMRFAISLYVGVRGTKHERYYTTVVNTLINENVYINPKESIVGEIIIDEGKENLRTNIRKHFFSKIKHKEIETILVAQFSTESEKIAYLLKQAVREVLYTCLVPDNFMETLIVYIAYKFAYNEPEIDKAVEQILAGQLSELQYSILRPFGAGHDGFVEI